MANEKVSALDPTTDLAGGELYIAIGGSQYRLPGNLIQPKLQLLKRQSTDTTNLGGTSANIGWDTNDITDAAYTVGGTGNTEITINAAGWYKIDCTLQVDGANNRSELAIQMQVDTGSGFANVTGERVSNYATRDANQDDGGVVLDTMYQFGAGDKARFVGSADVDGGSPNDISAGTRLVMMKVA